MRFDLMDHLLSRKGRSRYGAIRRGFEKAYLSGSIFVVAESCDEEGSNPVDDGYRVEAMVRWHQGE